MESNATTMDAGMGMLPKCAPLANPYVPFQQDNPPVYEPQRGLIRGTIYPGLDLPFLGMENKHDLPQTPMTMMQVNAFAIQELAMYLDTHPDDAQALQLYRAYQKRLQQQTEQYSKDYMPTNHVVSVDHKHYSWLDDPWPWEYAANKEV